MQTPTPQPGYQSYGGQGQGQPSYGGSGGYGSGAMPEVRASGGGAGKILVILVLLLFVVGGGAAGGLYWWSTQNAAPTVARADSPPVPTPPVPTPPLPGPIGSQIGRPIQPMNTSPTPSIPTTPTPPIPTPFPVNPIPSEPTPVEPAEADPPASDDGPSAANIARAQQLAQSGSAALDRNDLQGAIAALQGAQRAVGRNHASIRGLRGELTRKAGNMVGIMLQRGQCAEAQTLYRGLRSVGAERASSDQFGDWCRRP